MVHSWLVKAVTHDSMKLTEQKGGTVSKRRGRVGDTGSSVRYVTLVNGGQRWELVGSWSGGALNL